jgi:outer membrane protein TolC
MSAMTMWGGWAVALLCLAGCAMSPKSSPTLADLEVPDHYAAASPAAPEVARIDTTRWWLTFDDPVLGDLIARQVVDAAAPPASAGASGGPRTVEIVRRYISLRASQAMTENIHTYMAAQQADQEIARFREAAQLVTGRDPLQASAARDRAAADLPMLAARIAADIARLAVLTGRAPASLHDQLAKVVALPEPPAQIGVGAPADLIENRADLRRAQAALAKSRWRGDGGRAFAAYRRSVLLALEEAEDAQAAFVAAGDRIAALDQAAVATERLALMARRQYRDGEVDYSVLEAANGALLSIRNAKVAAVAERANAAIDLFLALGEGKAAPHG